MKRLAKNTFTSPLHYVGVVCFFLCAAGAQAVNVNLTLTNNQIAKVPDYFRSVTLDWWLSTDKKYGHKWGNSSILTIDLQDPSLVTLTKALAPGILRIGGSPEDSITYDFPQGFCSKNTEPSPPVELPGYYCSQVKPTNYGCLTLDRWKQINAFAAVTGLKLVFGLNACYGRKDGADKSMNFDNLEDLLKATAGQPWSRLWGLEFGNELQAAEFPRISEHGIGSKRYAQDFVQVSKIIDKLWTGHRSTKPKLIGPDTAPYMNYMADIIHWVGVEKPGAMHAMSYHQYPDCSAGSHKVKSETVLDLKCLEKIPDTAYTMNTELQATNITLWAGETALQVDGGKAGLTDTFMSTFYYMYQLGELAKRNVSVVARQTLMGGDYELVDRNTGLPNPDYWGAWLWGELMGGTTLDHLRRPTRSELPGVFTYTHAHPSGAQKTALLINSYTNRTVSVSLKGIINATLYEMRQKPGDDRKVLVNGQELVFQNKKLPTIKTIALNGPIVLRPESMVFAVV